MKKIAVFCGSSYGAKEAYREGAIALGKALAARGISLVYGGSSIGLMGAVADAVLEEGGQVTGVLPVFLQDREIAHRNLSELIIVETMHERKAKMAEIADGFVVLPGGAGTMDEFFEIFTWGQLGLHGKPCGLLNLEGYYDLLIGLFNHMTNEQFIQEKFRNMILSDESPEGLLDQFLTYEPPAVKTFLTSERQL